MGNLKGDARFFRPPTGKRLPFRYTTDVLREVLHSKNVNLDGGSPRKVGTDAEPRMAISFEGMPRLSFFVALALKLGINLDTISIVPSCGHHMQPYVIVTFPVVEQPNTVIA